MCSVRLDGGSVEVKATTAGLVALVKVPNKNTAVRYGPATSITSANRREAGKTRWQIRLKVQERFVDRKVRVEAEEDGQFAQRSVATSFDNV